MSSKENGGPAFPVLFTEGTAGFDPGMSLRDYFAAKAMAALVVLPTWPGSEVEEDARVAYSMADAMLKERAK